MARDARWLRTGLWLTAGALALAACEAAGDNRPIHPGGGGGNGSGSGGDAAVDAPTDDGGNGMLRGTVCIVADLRQPGRCAASGADGILVSEVGTSNTATTDTAGDFAMAVSGTGTTVLEAGRTTLTVVPSLVPVAVGGGRVEVPVVRDDAFNELVIALGPVIPNGTGTVALTFETAARAPIAGVAVVAPAGAANQPFYDLPGGPTDWTTDGGTGAFGAALLFGVPPPTADVSASDSGGADLSPGRLPVDDDHVTFATVIAP